MAYLIAAILMTLSVLEGNSPIASLFKCNISYLWHVTQSFCICKAYCFWTENVNPKSIRGCILQLNVRVVPQVYQLSAFTFHEAFFRIPLSLLYLSIADSMIDFCPF